MMLPIQIDTQGLSQEFDLTQENVDELLEAVVLQVRTEVANNWREEAKRELKQTRSQYLNSIIEGQDGRFTGTITLVGVLPNMIEQGASAFDMKKGFENSPKKKLSKSSEDGLGWYLTIPFTWASPDSVGESTKFTGKLPVDVHKALLRVDKKQAGAALSMRDIPAEFQVPTVRREIRILDTDIPAYTSKNSIFEGLSIVREEGSKSGQIMSFRRVSSNSDDNSWIHTGIQARNLAQKALDATQMDKIVGDVIDVFLNQL